MEIKISEVQFDVRSISGIYCCVVDTLFVKGVVLPEAVTGNSYSCTFTAIKLLRINSRCTFQWKESLEQITCYLS